MNVAMRSQKKEKGKVKDTSFVKKPVLNYRWLV